MTNGLKTGSEHQLARQLFSERIQLPDGQFSAFLAGTKLNSIPLISLNDVITLKTETAGEYIMTEMEFRQHEITLPYGIKIALIDEFSAIFQDV